MAKNCIVAGLRFIIDTADRPLLDRLAPRYAPFSTPRSEAEQHPLLFAIHHTEPFAPLAEARLMCEFDCEGTWCVFEQNDDAVSITLQDPQSRRAVAQMQSDLRFADVRC